MKAGIIGLTGVGKSALFPLLTGPPTFRRRAGRRPGRASPGCRTRGSSAQRDVSAEEEDYATVEYVDVPGVAKGEGSALVDLPALRGVDALVHVVRAFESELVPHPDGSVDPLRDAKMLELELILADLGAVEKRIEKLEANIKKAKRPKTSPSGAVPAHEGVLEAEKPLRGVDLTEEERRRLRNYSFLSEKPLLIVAEPRRRAGQGRASDRSVGLRELAARPGLCGLPVSATIEAEMRQLPPDDARAFMDDLGLKEPGLDRVIHSSYTLLGLISFLTAGEDECRAWTIRRGTKAQQAAGAIHSDIERGFIRAEVVSYEDLVAAGSLAACRDKATLRLEGKDYVVHDGDVINFRFNV